MPMSKEDLLTFFERETALGSVRKSVLTQIAALGQVERLRAGEQLFRCGQECHKLHFLMEGQCAVFLLSEDGRERILHLALPGDMVGAVAFFDGLEYPCNLKALVDSRFVAFHRTELLDLLRGDGETMLALLGGILDRQRKVVAQLAQLSFEDTSTRLWRFLLESSSANDGGGLPRVVESLPTRETIAQAIGTVREVVSRRLAEFVRSESIALEGRRVTLLRDPTGAGER